jgi:integrase
VRRTNQSGHIMRHRGWWVLRYRERVGVGGQLMTVQRAKRLVPVDARHKTKASVRRLAEQQLEPLNRNSILPLSITTVGDFVARVYLPFVKQQKRPSTYRGYSQMWTNYLNVRCESDWLREVKTLHVQKWLEEVAKEYGISKTTLKHVKNFLSGVFRHAAQQGYFDAANPVKLAEIPSFAPNGKETKAYSLEEIGAMLRVLSEPAATVIATAAYTGLRLGELRGLTWESYEQGQDDESLGLLHVTRSVWRSHVGEPKTEKSKAPVPVIQQLAERLTAHRELCRNPLTGPIFANSLGRPLDLERLYRVDMKDVLTRSGITWAGWHGFRRGLASNLNRLGVDDSVIQAILRHSTVAITQACYIKTARVDAVAAMRQLSAALKSSNCSPLCAPDKGPKVPQAVQ